MTIEPMKSVAMTYQGSSNVTEIKSEAVAKAENSPVAAATASLQLAKETMAMDTKQMSKEGGNSNNPNQQT